MTPESRETLNYKLRECKITFFLFSLSMFGLVYISLRCVEFFSTFVGVHVLFFFSESVTSV